MAAILYKRRAGTGWITTNRQGSRYAAFTPQVKGERKAKLLGWFDTHREATKVLETWLASNVAGCEGRL